METEFELLAEEIGIEITTDKNGFYTRFTKALYEISCDVILSDNEEIFRMDPESKKELIKQKFYKAFPYMEKK